jgi:glutaredoxin-dependent peroxiredoxin
MALEIGTKAPEFTLKSKNLTGEVKDISLGDYKGKNVVLLFHPQAFTGTCTTEMCTVSEGFEYYAKLDAVVLGISVDSVFTLEAWGKQNNITIPLLSDFNKEVIKSYGTIYPDGGFVFGMNGVSRRSAFVVDKEGIIRYKEILDDAGKLPDFDKIKEVLKSL